MKDKQQSTKKSKSLRVCECGCSYCTPNHNCQPCQSCRATGVIYSKGQRAICQDCLGTGRIVLEE